MSDVRPSPDALLSRIVEEGNGELRGRLKVFFGANAGVGKTYAMLEAAQTLAREGQHPIIGIVETHKRKETEAMVEGLEVLPRKTLQHRGMTLEEFDLDEALARKPKLILIDELAHTNAPGSRHEKRWQDVMELLSAGSDVYTTVNVQHLESLNNVVEQITHVKVRETVPDQVVEQANEIVIVDLSPQELLLRLREGKVYTGAQATAATDNFFKTGNLLALRELALRFVAKRVNAAVQVYRDAEATKPTWPTQELLMVAVGPSPSSAKLVRTTRRMAAGFGADWIAAYVSTPHTAMNPGLRESVTENLRLAQSLGAEVVSITGKDIPSAILDYAHDRNVTKIITGKPLRSRWREIITPSPVDRLIRESGDIDVYVIRGEGNHTSSRRIHSTAHIPKKPYAASVAMVVLSSVLSWAVYPFFETSDLSMVYLLGITGTALFGSRGATLLATVLSVASFNVLYVPPRFSFNVEAPRHIWTFVVMFAVGTIISLLTFRLRQQVIISRESEQRTANLHRLSRRLSSLRGTDVVLSATIEEIAGVFSTQVIAFITDQEGKATFCGGHPVSLPPTDKEIGVAQWVFDNSVPAGAGTGTLEGSLLLHMPLRVGDNSPLAVVSVFPPDNNRMRPEQMQLLESFCSQAALALEVDRLEQQRRVTDSQIETERLRSSVLSTVSHDLRTPIASIQGCSESLLENETVLSNETRRELLHTITDESHRISSMITNLLDMTRLEGGGLRLYLMPIPIDEIVGSSLAAMGQRIAEREINILLPPDLPFVLVDEMLIQHVMTNLLDNALKYSPEGGSIEIAARQEGNFICLEVADQGPGLAPGEELIIFEKFQRGRASQNTGGVGLGLAICKAIVEAHNGFISAKNEKTQGARFMISLPIAPHSEALPEDQQT